MSVLRRVWTDEAGSVGLQLNKNLTPRGRSRAVQAHMKVVGPALLQYRLLYVLNYLLEESNKVWSRNGELARRLHGVEMLSHQTLQSGRLSVDWPMCLSCTQGFLLTPGEVRLPRNAT